MVRVAIIVDGIVENVIVITQENLDMLSDIEYIISDTLEIGDIIS
jgi:hypothetical protein